MLKKSIKTQFFATAASAASARAAPDAGIFEDLHSIPGDLVDLLTENGGFAFLEDLHETGRLWDLRNFRIPRAPSHLVSFNDSAPVINNVSSHVSTRAP